MVVLGTMVKEPITEGCVERRQGSRKFSRKFLKDNPRPYSFFSGLVKELPALFL